MCAANSLGLAGYCFCSNLFSSYAKQIAEYNVVVHIELVHAAEQGVEVHLVVDGISSQRLTDRQIALEVSSEDGCRIPKLHCLLRWHHCTERSLTNHLQH